MAKVISKTFWQKSPRTSQFIKQSDRFLLGEITFLLAKNEFNFIFSLKTLAENVCNGNPGAL